MRFGVSGFMRLKQLGEGDVDECEKGAEMSPILKSAKHIQEFVAVRDKTSVRG